MKRLAPFRIAPGMLAAYHSGDEWLRPGSIRAHLHVGTAAQAVMRSGRRISLVVFREAPVVRMRDREENGWRLRRLQTAVRRGKGIALYLNRIEGIPADEASGALETLRARRSRQRLDTLPDSAFRRLMPSCADSMIILHPDLVVATIHIRARPADASAAALRKWNRRAMRRAEERIGVRPCRTVEHEEEKR